MPIRHNRQTQSGGAAPRRSPARRPSGERRWTSARLSALLVLVLVSAGLLAPAGQARPARGGSPEEESAAASRKAAVKEERAAAKRAEKVQLRGERLAEDPSREGENYVVTFGCTEVTWMFRKFPDRDDNTVKLIVNINHHSTHIVETFSFDGETGSTTTPISAPPGMYIIDARAMWKTNGAHGGFDVHSKVECPPAPAFTIEKLQRIGSGAFTTSTLEGDVGQTVDYEIVLKNTGNVPLSFSSLMDANCDEGTLTGGPGESPLAVGASAIYMCTHALSAEDRSAGSRSNRASTTGTPPDGDGSRVTHTSNTVIVTLAPPAPAFTIEKLQRIPADGGSFTTSTLTGAVGQTVDYEILVDNTGDVPLTLGSLSDSQCDAGTITGGPVGGTLEAGESSTYNCNHVLTTADQTAGSFSNTASLVGTPPEGDGSAISHQSNTVVVTLSAPTPPGGTPQTPPPSSNGKSGVLSSIVTEGPESGVLAISATSVPGLIGPQGCVRAAFRASVKAAGVQSVTFYLDGHKLKTLTAKNARKGLLSIQINPSKWTVGSHKLVAKITMVRAGSTKAITASRMVRVLRCRAAILTPKFTG